MHILVISSFLPPYGGYFCVEQAKALRSLGHEVRILLAQQLGLTVYPKMYFSAPFDRWWENDDNVEIYRTNFRGIPKVVKPNMQRYCNLISEMYDEYVIKYGHPDILHAHAAKWTGVAARKISIRTGIPYIITEHISRGAYEREFGEGWQKHQWVKAVLRDAYRSASCVVPVARELVASTSDFFGKDYRWTEISNLIDVDFFSYKERQPLEGRPFRFCCLAIANGKWFYYKGYDVLLAAFNGMTDAELHIAGRATNGETMRKAVDGIENVFIHGDLTKSQVRDLLYTCDALVLASRGEVQPLVVLEAMSTGIPVVATDVIPQSERIPGACLIVPAGNASALCEAMQHVKTIPSSEDISMKVREIASATIVAKRLEALFKQTLI